MDIENTWLKAEQLRATHFPPPKNTIPVDVLWLVELGLGLDIIPFDDLYAKYKVDAAIAPDHKGLYVDAESYILWEQGPMWKQNRLRFTVAHELGHLMLHEPPKFASIDSYLDYLKTPWTGKYTQEQEANEFAGRLLVPIDKLRNYFDEFALRIQQLIPDWKDSQDLRIKFARQVAPKFAVHEDALLTRLSRERLWTTQQ